MGALVRPDGEARLNARVGKFWIVRGPDRRAKPRPGADRREAEDWTGLHEVIDAYMAHERGSPTARGFSQNAAGTERAGSGHRQWHDEFETMTEALERNELKIVERCWAQLGLLHEACLRADYATRGDTRYHAVNPMDRVTQDRMTRDAKLLLRRHLHDNGVRT